MPIFRRLSQIMAMLKHHDESDAAFLTRVKQSMEALYKEFADQTSTVDYIKQYWGSDSKLSKSWQLCKHGLH